MGKTATDVEPWQQEEQLSYRVKTTSSSFPLIILVRQTSPPPPHTISHWTCSQLNGGPREQHKRMFSCSCLYRIRQGGSSFAFARSVHRGSLTKFLFFLLFLLPTRLSEHLLLRVFFFNFLELLQDPEKTGTAWNIFTSLRDDENLSVCEQLVSKWSLALFFCTQRRFRVERDLERVGPTKNQNAVIIFIHQTQKRIKFIGPKYKKLSH